MRAYIAIVSALSRAGGILAMLLLAAAVLVTCQMIVVRYFLNASTVWQTEFVIYSIVAATFIGSPAVLIDRGHVGVEVLPNMLSPGPRFWLELAGAIAGLVFCILLAWSGGIFFYEALTRGWKTSTVWALPLWIPTLPLPLGIGLLALQYTAEMLKLRQGERLTASELPMEELK
ncbi:TRAP transporter small permease [Lutibaculum baratangense]|uniref:TRAP transporter small permease protein n=1 Tax=Lutibaculum baratangense AMV1 TaxID=631454 RepID=V4R2S2_9HYPH|nr:TRAP transporter small permease [Lutibaculum baratangense]ESR26252.1 TRAP dicarboxylate transporter, DctQ subunit, unknown substrate 4 [Lutibaculum baratangense AMV1]